MPHRARLLICPEHTELREKAAEGEEEDRQDSGRDAIPVDRQVFEHRSQGGEVDDEEYDVEHRDRARDQERGEAGDPALGPAESWLWIVHGEMVRPKGFEPLAF